MSESQVDETAAADAGADTESEHESADVEVTPPSDKDQPTYQRFKQQKVKKPKMDAVDAKLLELLSKETMAMPAETEEPYDEDRGFFMSLWKDFKCLPASNKLSVKMQLMQVKRCTHVACFLNICMFNFIDLSSVIFVLTYFLVLVSVAVLEIIFSFVSVFIIFSF